MTEIEPEIYYAVEGSEFQELIPSSAKVLYSSLCRAEFHGAYSVQGTYGVQSIHKFDSPVIITTEGVAYIFPTNGVLGPRFDHLGEITSLSPLTDYPGLEIRRITYLFTMNSEFETFDSFKERGARFEDKFRPLILKKKKEWVELNKDNPNVGEIPIVQAGHFITRMEKEQAKWEKQEAKRKKKEAKKKK